MIRLRTLPLGGIPRIAIGLSDKVLPEVIIDAEHRGVDIVELRIDLYSNWAQDYVVKEVQRFQRLPSIATIRSKADGGKWDRPDLERLELFKAVIPYVDAIDIEVSSRGILQPVTVAAREAKKLLMMSFHDFKKTPSKDVLSRIVNEAKSLGADIVKIATFAASEDDVRTLADLTMECKHKNIVTIAMGSIGTISRITFPALGSLITYASLGPATGPGQLSYDDTFEMIRRLYPRFNEEKISVLGLLEAV